MATPPPTAPEIIIENPPTPQTNLQLETQTPPPPIPKSNPSSPFFCSATATISSDCGFGSSILPLQSQPLPSFSFPPVELPSTEGLASMPLMLAVIQVCYHPITRFVWEEVLKGIIGFCVREFMEYLFLS